MCRPKLLSKSGGGALLFVTTFAQLLTLTNGSSCRYSYYSSCKVNPKSATYEVTFSVDSVESNADINKYPVTATFHWGVANTTKVGEYQPGKDVKISDTYIYDSNGYYTTGISLSFGKGAAGCTGSTLSEYDTLYLGGTSCDYGVDTPPPTPKPTSKPEPTPEPTDKPVTTFPTVKETPEPSPEPTNAPTTPEPVTTTTTTVAATITTTSEMATTEPSSNVSPTTAATATTTATTTTSATNSATASTSSASSTTTTTTASVATTSSSSTSSTGTTSPQQQTVRSRMTLYNSAKLDDKALSKWEKKTIQQILTHNGEDADVMTVTLDNVSQEEAGGQRSLRRRFLLRHLTEEEGPLTIDFDAIVKSDESSSLTAQDANDIVSAGFSTSARQTEYIYSLKSADSSVFGGIDRMVMVVDGTTLETSSGGGNTGIDGVQRPDGGGGNGADPANNGGGSMGAIIGGVVGGALVLFVVVGSILYSRRRQHETSTSGSFSKDTKGVGDDIMGKEWSTRTGNDSPDAQTCATPYLGTIESREGEDDVSTLGDPYFGEAINALDTGTVAESMISSDMLALGVKRNKGFSSNASRMDATTATGYTSGVGSAYPMTFADDTTLDDAYQTPADLEYGEEDDEDYERVVVVAPSGKLGIVIDNPSGGIPFVHAIKESSVLHGKVFVGDLVLSVDEVDCRGMHSLAVSKLISKRSENPARTLRLLRNST